MRLLFAFLLTLTVPAFGDPPKKKSDVIVNKHLTKAAKEKELQRQRAAIEARKNAKVVPPKPQPKIDPAHSNGVILEQEPNAFVNEKTTEVYKPLRDPGSEIQAEVTQEKQEFSETEYEKRQLIQKLKSEAEKSGYKVNVIEAK